MHSMSVRLNCSLIFYHVAICKRTLEALTPHFEGLRILHHKTCHKVGLSPFSLKFSLPLSLSPTLALGLAAFQRLELDCANWSDPVYLDLARKGGGDEERMLVVFFNRIGWPTSLPTSEKENFMKSVLHEECFTREVSRGQTFLSIKIQSC